MDIWSFGIIEINPIFGLQGTASSEGSDDPAGAASSTDEIENNIPDSPHVIAVSTDIQSEGSQVN